MNYLFDTHSHLNLSPLTENFEQVLKNAEENNVKKILIPGADKKSSLLAIELSQKKPNLYAAIGVHPTEIDELNFNWIEKNIKNIKAIGEIGLDYYCEKDPKKWEIQKQAFEMQIKIAQKYDLPIIVHARDAILDSVEIMQKLSVKKAVFHCFTGNIKEAKEIVKNGWLISFTGIITYPKAEEIRECIKITPLDKIMVETDSPYLAPQKMRGKTCEPAFVIEVAKKIAEIKNIDFKEVCEKTTQNACEFFRIN